MRNRAGRQPRPEKEAAASERCRRQFYHTNDRQVLFPVDYFDVLIVYKACVKIGIARKQIGFKEIILCE